MEEDDDISVYVYGTEFDSGLNSGSTLANDLFVIGSAAADGNDRFIYNQNTGALFFDSDGTGATEQVQLALLSPGLAMTNADILLRQY